MERPPRRVSAEARDFVGLACAKIRPADSCRAAARTAEFEACAIGGDHIAVMLHLRSLYVSKAAILTIPVLSVPVENRSPA
jgi:hypothetical protein